MVAVDLEVGELMQLDRRAFAEAMKILLTGPRLGGARLRIHLQKASFECEKCGNRWGMAEAEKQLALVPEYLRIREPDGKVMPLHFLPYLYQAFVRCPRCGSSDISAVEGKELRLRRLDCA